MASVMVAIFDSLLPRTLCVHVDVSRPCPLPTPPPTLPWAAKQGVAVLRDINAACAMLQLWRSPIVKVGKA